MRVEPVKWTGRIDHLLQSKTKMQFMPVRWWEWCFLLQPPEWETELKGVTAINWQNHSRTVQSLMWKNQEMLVQEYQSRFYQTCSASQSRLWCLRWKPDNSFSFDLSVLSNHPENCFNPKGSLFHSFIGVYKWVENKINYVSRLQLLLQYIVLNLLLLFFCKSWNGEILQFFVDSGSCVCVCVTESC